MQCLNIYYISVATTNQSRRFHALPDVQPLYHEGIHKTYQTRDCFRKVVERLFKD